MKRKDGKLIAGFQFKFSSAAALGAIVTVMASFGMVWLLNHVFDVSLGVPTGVRMLIFGIVFGVAIAAILNHAFIKPLTDLAAAMRRVADGNFDTQLECKSTISDIKEVYASFNLMVKALGETETLQTDFVSNVSHEFKTPINAIEGYASLLQDSELPREQQAQYVGKIIFNTRRLSDLVGNILLLSKVNNESIRPKANTYRLDEQIRQSIFALERKWTEKSIDLDIEMDEVEYCGYEGFMMHVWTNLIDNAIKFDSYGGSIRLRLKKDGERVRFTVSDTGPGIAPEEQSRIFTKFYQVDSSHKEEGNGLGLALVKRIVTSSGGNISVESEPGAGATFTVELPLSVKDTPFGKPDAEEENV